MYVRRAREAETDMLSKQAEDIFAIEQKIPREYCPIPAQKRPMWWCAEQAGDIVGTVAAYWEGEVCHMGRMTVSRELRRQHIATELLTFSVEDLFDQGIDELFMEAREITVHILLKMGAEVVGETVPFYEGTVTPLILKKENYKSRA